mgnify:FL=1|jgi:hypothetical protein
MAETGTNRGPDRDRHGRGIRQPLVTDLLPGRQRLSSFEQIVSGTCDYLINAWPDELAELSWEIADAPSISAESKGVRRWAVKRDQMTIVIYRLPIERLGHHRRTDALHERMHIEEFVFAAVGHLIGKDPWDLVPERYRD